MTRATDIIDDYLFVFGEMPPRDMVIPYESNIYIELMKEAIKTGKKITPEILEQAIGDQPYDVDIGGGKKFTNFGKS